jgi:PAS domain S-box-containing protein
MTPPEPVSPAPAWRATAVAAGAAAVGGLLVGALLPTGWLELASPLRFGMALAAVGLLVLGCTLWWRKAVAGNGRESTERALLAQRAQQLERRARQLDEAELLVDLGSFDWVPGTGELHWSNAHYRLWGYQPGTVTPSFEVFKGRLHPEDAERVLAALQQALTGQCRYDCQHRLLLDDGRQRHIHARGEVFFNAAGEPERMIGAVLDITERVQAEDALRLYEFVLDAIPDPVGVVDGDTRYRLANRAWLAANDRTRENTLGRTVQQVYPVVVSPERRQMMLDCLAGKPAASVRSVSPSPHSAGRRLETRYFPFHEPGISRHGVVMVSRDVTEDERVQEALFTSIDNLRLTLNTIGDGIFASDAANPDEPVLFVNDQLLDLFRIPAVPGVMPTPRQINAHARRFFTDPEAELAIIESLIAENRAGDHRLELNDGRVLMRRARATPRGNRPVRVWAFRDITAEAQALRALAEAEARQRTLLAAFPGFIWVLDAHERLVYINPTAAAVYRPYVPKVGVSTDKLFGPEVSARIRPNVQRALAGETLSVEWHRPSVSGRSPSDMLIKMVPGTAPDGLALCYAFGIDISSLKQAEAALVTARDGAERANQAKTQFLSSMSHELRTPLNAVIGFSQVLEHNVDGNLNARQLRQLGEIRRAGSHLLALISDLLDLSRIEAGRTSLTLVPVAVGEVADECVQLVQPMLAREGQVLQLDANPPLVVLADRTRLKQVLLNLLSNAIKYNRAGGRVRLAWLASDDGVRVEVHDQGPGLSEEAQSRLFTPFERLGAEAGHTEGTGIGLALSRQLMQLMQGSIGVRSEVGQGCCFWLRLPAATVAAPGADSVTRLLYLDDNPVNLSLMEGLLEDQPGLVLATSSDPSRALALSQAGQVDALLLDLQMPAMDGFEVHARLRSHAATRSLPVVAVSADVTAATRARCRELGFVDYVTKPVDADQLLTAVSRLLKAARARRAEAGSRQAATSPST